MKLIETPSLNFDERPEGHEIKYLIYHYTAVDLEISLKYLQYSKEPNRVSAHYLICEEGHIYKLVDEKYRAWHAGQSAWGEDQMLNATSIGIELVNPGHGPLYRLFSEKQMKALEDLSKDILRRHKISPFHILGHSDIAPTRKQDPGELFNWQRLADQNIGIMPPSHLQPLNIDKDELKSAIHNLGYRPQSESAAAMKFVISAFQMHYGGSNANEIAARLYWLLDAKQN
jgi:N-acetylmuramoyl-L-alanine amidase